MIFCLNRNIVDEFLRRIKTGEIDPQKLAEMSSEERRSYFADFMGEVNAKEVNALFESKMLLKSQQQGMINWAKSVSGLRSDVRADIIKRVNKMTEVLNPADQQSFLEDLAAHRLGTTVTMEEASKISELAKIVSEKKTAIENGGDRLDYGAARVAFGDYINELKADAGKLSLRDRLNPSSYIKTVSDLAGIAKSVKASFDNSFFGRQGLRALWTDPKIWSKNFVQSFRDIANVLKSKDTESVMNGVKADIISRENALNGMYDRSKLAVGTIEESYPAHNIGKMPLLGKLYAASETAYTAAAYRMRADFFDKFIDIAKNTDVNLGDPKELQGIGKFANSLTGRGSLGRFEGGGASILNNIFFSPRFFKANIDALTHSLGFDLADGKVTKLVQKQAALSMLKVITGTATVLAIADTVWPGSVEKDPRSSDFGKIRIGDTRFDVTGGLGSIITLASRTVPTLWGKGATKSTSTGEIVPLNTGKYGSATGKDVFFNFLENKLSPAGSVVRDILKGQDQQGNKPTVKGELINVFAPLPITNFQELRKNPNAANLIAASIADALGISTNTYTAGIQLAKRFSVEDSQTVKRRIMEAQGIPASDASKYQLDHIIPIELAHKDGNNQAQDNELFNSDQNLKLVSTVPDKPNEKTSPASRQDRVENYLGKLYKGKRISIGKAQEFIIDFKNGTKSFADIEKWVKDHP